MSSFKTSTIRIATGALARARRKQRVHKASNSIFKVNIGCGLAVAPGWVNIDGSLNAWLASQPSWILGLAYKLSGSNRYYSRDFYLQTLADNEFVFHDITYGLPFQNETVDYIFSSHFVEHLSLPQTHFLFRECHRSLKRSGVLRVAVPDLEYAWELYRRGEKERMLHDYFFTDSETPFSRHRYAYDFELMERALSEAGFNQIERCEYRRGRTPDLDVLDNRGEYSLFVEASKGV